DDDAQCFLWKLDPIGAQRHPASSFFLSFDEFLRCAERAPAVGEVFQGLIIEVKIGIAVSRERSIFPCCKPSKICLVCCSLGSLPDAELPNRRGAMRRAISPAALDASSLVSTVMAALSSGKTMFCEVNPETSPLCATTR